MRSAHAEQLTNSSSIDEVDTRPSLTKQQTEFFHVYSAAPFMPEAEVCRQAGIRPAQVTKWKKNSEKFRQALAVEHRRSQRVINMSRKVVMDGLLTAIDMAKDQRQPGGMISGWKEIGRICGFYEPERREISISVNGQDLVEQLKFMPKEKLLELASQHDAMDGEFEVIED